VIFLVSGFAIVPLTLSAELALSWLSPHGDGLPRLLLAVVLMLVLCAASHRILRSPFETDDRMAHRRRLVRADVSITASDQFPLFVLGKFRLGRIPAGPGEF
jgi:hypothetical protein